MQKGFKFIIALLLSLILIQCGDDVEIDNFEIIKYRKVANNYHYNEFSKSFEDLLYDPVITIKYKDGKLAGAILFKSEGILSYSVDDLNNDKLLKTHLKLQDAIKIRIGRDMVHFGDNNYKIFTSINDTIFCPIQDSLIIFIRK